MPDPFLGTLGSCAGLQTSLFFRCHLRTSGLAAPAPWRPGHMPHAGWVPLLAFWYKGKQFPFQAFGQISSQIFICGFLICTIFNHKGLFVCLELCWVAHNLQDHGRSFRSCTATARIWLSRAGLLKLCLWPKTRHFFLWRRVHLYSWCHIFPKVCTTWSLFLCSQGCCGSIWNVQMWWWSSQWVPLPQIPGEYSKGSFSVLQLQLWGIQMFRC